MRRFAYIRGSHHGAGASQKTAARGWAVDGWVGMTQHLGMPLDATLRSRMQGHVDRGVGGLAWAVSVGRDNVASGAAGWLDPDGQTTPMPADGLFRIASVSKPIVAVAALRLVDAGLIELDEPVDTVLPELTDRRVLTDPHGPLDQPTVPAARALTLRDLLTFRCGLGMDFDFTKPQPVLDRLWELGIGPGPTPPDADPDTFMAHLAELPLADQPGTQWRYHTGSDIVSVLIERLHGDTLGRILARDIFRPLGMVDTAFWAEEHQHARLGQCRTVNDAGALVVWDAPDGRWAEPPAFRSGAAGLLSTASDLIRFGCALLDGGSNVLSAASVDAMTTDQLTGEQRLAARIGGDGLLGWGFGVGVRTNPTPGGWPRAGSYGWDGGLGSRWFVDPATETCAVLLSTDAFSSPEAPIVMDDFVSVLAAAVGRIVSSGSG